MAARLSYEERLARCKIPLLRKLYKIIIDKKSNLCVAADLDSVEKISRLVEKIGPYICILKLHSEFFESEKHAGEDLKLLYKLKKKHNFLLFEDRKFADSGATIKSAYRRYVNYVDLVTVLPIFGDSIFNAIKSCVEETSLPDDEHRGCLAVCELSLKDVVPLDNKLLLEIAQRNSPICVGIIGQKLTLDDPVSMFKATPGVNRSQSTDGQDQQWRTPDNVVNDGADVIIVGRGIISKPESQWESEAIFFKEMAFKAYLRALSV